MCVPPQFAVVGELGGGSVVGGQQGSLAGVVLPVRLPSEAFAPQTGWVPLRPSDIAVACRGLFVANRGGELLLGPDGSEPLNHCGQAEYQVRPRPRPPRSRR